MNKKLLGFGLVATAALLVFLLVMTLAQRAEKGTEEKGGHQEGVFLPGTQPNELTSLDAPKRCRQCHAHNSEIAPYRSWRGSMMSQATRDPLFYAALAIANQDIEGSGDFCLRCHTPQGWLLGRSEPTDGSALADEDLDGITCDSCHRTVDPFTDEGRRLVKEDRVPAYGNGMYVVSRDDAKRGPYDDANPPHDAKYSPFHSSGDFCGTCHDVTNPINKVPIERTYSEWKHSWYADQGQAGSCQSCHMRSAAGYAAQPELGKVDVPYREKIPIHDLTGGSNWVYDVLPLLWDNLDIAALKEGKSRALNTLKSAADLEISYVKGEDGLDVDVKITNKTGHKLPTGYPEGRRMWINVKGLDTAGNTVFESGRYDETQADLVRDKQLKVYQAKPAIKGRGPTFHFVLNDYIAFDNRIPPKGFTNKAFNKAGADVIGHSYEDGQYWDNTKYSLPDGTARILVNLMYQSSEKSYIEFLAKKNKTDNWGKKLVRVWKKTGRGAPVIMSSKDVAVE